MSKVNPRRNLTLKERVAIGKLKDRRQVLLERAAMLRDERIAVLFGVSRRTINRE